MKAVLEARKTEDRGVVATLLVQNGTLKKGDFILAGPGYGRVRAMTGHDGKPISEAGPSTPVELLGLAEELGADLVVMGTQGHTGLKHVLLASVAERTLRHAPCSVLTVKRH